MSATIDDSNDSPDAESNESPRERLERYTPTVQPAVRELVGDGRFSMLGGVVSVVRGLRSLRRGKTRQGLFRLVTGGAFLAIGAAQRRASRGQAETGDTDVDQTDVVGRDSDIEAVSDGLDTDDGTDGERDPAAVGETGPDVEDVDTAPVTARDSEDTPDEFGAADVVTTGVDAAPVSEAGSDGGAAEEQSD